MSNSLARRSTQTVPYGTHFRGLNRVFDDLFPPSHRLVMGREFSPSVDVKRDEEKICIHAEIPGMTKKDISLVVEDDILTIEGHKRSEMEEGDESRHFSDRLYGEFSRRIDLGDGIDPSKAKAEYKNGILSICIPIDETKSNKFKIDVK